MARTINHPHSVATFALILLAAGQTPAAPATQPAKESPWKYAPEALQPFWLSDTMHGESVLFVRQNEAAPITGALIFPPTRIISVKNSAGDVTYSDGQDYTWKPGSRVITVPADSRIPTQTWQELRRQPGSQPFNMAHRDGQGEILLSEQGDYARMQVVVTYQHEMGEWAGPKPGLAKDALPRTLRKLAAKEPVTIVLLGDSISTGASSSSQQNIPPYQPGWHDLLMMKLQEAYKSKITLKNLAVGGMDTPWGVTQVDAVAKNAPDLVILAFGMNDSGGRPTAEYKANTQAMIDGIRKGCPDAEFMLIATMMGNKDWAIIHPELWPEYRAALAQLCGPGIALADLTNVWGEMLKHKQYLDITGNGVNHPNDFCHRVYAQVLASLLVSAESQEKDRWMAQNLLAASPRLPASFVYGGRPSSELLPTWTHTTENRKLDATRTQHTLTWDDPKTGLNVRCVAVEYTDFPAVEWTLHFKNNGQADTPVLERVKAIDVVVKAGPGDPILHRLKGSTCSPDDWAPIDEALPSGKRVDFGAQNGRSSAESPFFNLQCAGGGRVVGIGWSGQWRASVEHRPDGTVALQAGMEFLHVSLHPGEAIRSPRVLQLFWTGDDQFRGCNLLRQTMLTHILPRLDGQVVTPVITNCAAGIPTTGQGFWQYMAGWTEQQAHEELRSIEGLGYEFFWVDAYFTRGNFPKGIGNYGYPIDEIVTDPQRFPHGPKPLGRKAHEQGMKFLVWFEPERAAKDTYLAKEHPEWILFDPTGQDGGINNLFNLAIPEAREYMTKFLIAAVREYAMDCLRSDFNLDPLPLWQLENAKDPNRVGMSEIRYVEGLYRMWDDILAACPNLFIDNCASGGRRIDLETCSRSIPLWRTDAQSPPSIALDYNQASIQSQSMSAGLNRYVPFSTGAQIVKTPYDFRSGFNGGIVVWNIPTAEQHAVLKQGVAEGKRIRKYWLGDFYPLSDVTNSPKEWCVTQYHRPDTGEGMVMAFRRHESEQATYQCKLREIDEHAQYEVRRSYGFEPLQAEALTGRQLAALLVEIPDRPGSVIIEYKLK